MKFYIADAHKNIFSYCSFLKNRHIESRIVSRDVSKFKFHYVGSVERYDILQVKNAVVISVYYIIQCTVRSMMSNFVFTYYK